MKNLIQKLDQVDKKLDELIRSLDSQKSNSELSKITGDRAAKVELANRAIAVIEYHNRKVSASQKYYISARLVCKLTGLRHEFVKDAIASSALAKANNEGLSSMQNRTLPDIEQVIKFY